MAEWSVMSVCNPHRGQMSHAVSLSGDIKSHSFSRGGSGGARREEECRGADGVVAREIRLSRDC